jgi:hypothetical protein
VSIAPVDESQHGSDHVYSENVVSIREETDTGNRTRLDVVPTEWCGIDLCEGKPSSLSRILINKISMKL